MSTSEIAPDELRDSFKQLLRQESDAIASEAKSGRGKEAGEALLSKMAELGWLGITIDEQYGGLGLDFTALGILYEELGRSVAPAAVMPTMLAAEALQRCGSESQKSKWLPLLASGELAASLGLPFHGDQSDRRHSVAHILHADTKNLLLLPVAVSDGSMGLALIPPLAVGVTVEARPLIDLTRTLCTVRVNVSDLRSEQVMPVTAADWDRLLDHACVGLACDSVGGADRILERTVEYMQLRRQFDAPIGSFQALKHRVATWKILLESVRALTDHATHVLAAGGNDASTVASAAKYSACDAYAAIAGDAVQLHGGIGFTWEHDCHLFLKRAKLNAVLFGTAIQHKERIARCVLGKDLDETEVPSPLLAIEAPTV